MRKKKRNTKNNDQDTLIARYSKKSTAKLEDIANGNAGRQARLKTTGEIVTVVNEFQERGHNDPYGDKRFKCRLPPFAPGHRPRTEVIRADRLEFFSALASSGS